ncbi:MULTISPECIES: aa3-type cytochrome c oxidase subunit IV [unclassified Roseovarius]|nr:aa3-type cytochrome c oxidase subunit IV [Roseovarius sp. MMSF_3350]
MANEHKHGEMDIRVQEKTFEGFLKASAYVAAGSIIFLILLAMINI